MDGQLAARVRSFGFMFPFGSHHQVDIFPQSFVRRSDFYRSVLKPLIFARCSLTFETVGLYGACLNESDSVECTSSGIGYNLGAFGTGLAEKRGLSKMFQTR